MAITSVENYLTNKISNQHLNLEENVKESPTNSIILKDFTWQKDFTVWLSVELLTQKWKLILRNIQFPVKFVSKLFIWLGICISNMHAHYTIHHWSSFYKIWFVNITVHTGFGHFVTKYHLFSLCTHVYFTHIRMRII